MADRTPIFSRVLRDSTPRFVGSSVGPSVRHAILFVRVGVVVVVVLVVHTFKNGLTFERLDQFVSYLEGSCTRVSRFAAPTGPTSPPA